MSAQAPIVLIPVLDDWESLKVLISRLDAQDLGAGRKVNVVVVDDGSRSVPNMEVSTLTGIISSITIVSLKANQGHQRALALGLAYIYRNMSPEFVIVMDSDGEDRPEEVPRLVEEYDRKPDHIIVAKRLRRSEGFIFRLFYQIYKLLFMSFTGKPISFGNFSLIPQARLQNVIFNSGVWNNLAATVLKSRVPIAFVPTNRGARYHGKSTMNFTSLMIHGFSAMAIFSDVVIGRIIFFLTFMAIFVSAAVVSVLIIKLGTDIFVPGYATTIILFLGTFLALSLLTGFLMILTLLSRREQPSALPSQLVEELVSRTHVTEIATNKVHKQG